MVLSDRSYVLNACTATHEAFKSVRCLIYVTLRLSVARQQDVVNYHLLHDVPAIVHPGGTFNTEVSMDELSQKYFLVSGSRCAASLMLQCTMY